MSTEHKPHSEQLTPLQAQGGLLAAAGEMRNQGLPKSATLVEECTRCLVEQLQTARSERDEWEKRYEELLSAVGGVWPG